MTGQCEVRADVLENVVEDGRKCIALLLQM